MEDVELEATSRHVSLPKHESSVLAMMTQDIGCPTVKTTVGQQPPFETLRANGASVCFIYEIMH